MRTNKCFWLGYGAKAKTSARRRWFALAFA
jgi:hypothetical protein